MFLNGDKSAFQLARNRGVNHRIIVWLPLFRSSKWCLKLFQKSFFFAWLHLCPASWSVCIFGLHAVCRVCPWSSGFCSRSAIVHTLDESLVRYQLMPFGYLLNSYTISLQSSLFFMDEGTVFGVRSWSMVPTLSSRPRSFFQSMFEVSGPVLRNTGLLCVLQNSLRF